MSDRSIVALMLGQGENSPWLTVARLLRAYRQRLSKVEAKLAEPSVPGLRGDPGEPGTDGRGVVSFSVDDDGILSILLTDGSAVLIGKVVGDPGPPGDKGDPGESIKGDPGERGAEGLGIASALIDETGRLTLGMTDGRIFDLGIVRGKDGEPGRDGTPGIDGKDGLTGADGGIGPRGADGKDGAAGERGEPGAAGADGKGGLPGSDGRDGAPGIDGRDGIPGTDGKDGAPGMRGEIGPAGIDGRDGEPGIDGKDGASVTMEDLHPVVADVVAHVFERQPKPRDPIGLAGGLIAQDGHLVITLTDGTPVSVGRVVGRDGADGKDGVGIKGDPGERGEQGERGETGPPGVDGRDAVNPDAEAVAAILKAEIEAPLIERLDRAIDAIPVPQNGKDGKPGRNGTSGQSVKGDRGEPGSSIEVGDSAPAHLTATDISRIRSVEMIVDGQTVRVLTLS